MRDDSAEILFQSFLQEAIVSSSGMDKVTRIETSKKVRPSQLLNLRRSHFVPLCITPDKCRESGCVPRNVTMGTGRGYFAVRGDNSCLPSSFFF